MDENLLRSKLKEVVLIGCVARIVESAEGATIEVRPAPAHVGKGGKAGICAMKIDPWGNFFGCRNISCAAGCRACTDHVTGDYWCQCGKPCPPPPPPPPDQRRAASRPARAAKSKKAGTAAKPSKAVRKRR